MRSLPSTRTLVVLAGYGLGGLALYWGLPEQVPPSWAVSAHRTLWLGNLMAAFLLPTAAAITDRLLRGLRVKSPVHEPNPVNGLATYDAIMLRFTIFVMGVHGAVLLAMVGMLSGRRWTAQVVPLMLGFTMISIGNLLPRTRPNLAIGIRTRVTLSDRAHWIRVRRSVGYMVVGCGVVIVLSAMTVPRPVGPGMILLVGPAALAGTCLLVRSSRKPVHA
jgi:uncharacterized membrane protein